MLKLNHSNGFSDFIMHRTALNVQGMRTVEHQKK